MFDGKIDFMDFNKIKINYGGKLTCRKIFKKKYTIFLILSLIVNIFLVSLYTIKSNKIKGIIIEMKELDEQKSQTDNSINLLKKQNNEDTINISNLQNEIESIKLDIEEKTKKEEDTKNINKQKKDEKSTLEKRNTVLSSQLKTENELKEVYQQKISSLDTLLKNLKIEYEKIKQHKEGDSQKEDEESLSIKSSNILSSKEVSNIEKIIKGTISSKCFDGAKNNFDPQIFHEKCNDNPLLMLIKTDKNERIGAFTKASFDGFEIKRDISSALFNIDRNKFYVLANQEYFTIVCDPNELPQFGKDLKIKKNGQGINSFPFNYGDKNINEPEDLTSDNIFNIQNLEIYKVDL